MKRNQHPLLVVPAIPHKTGIRFLDDNTVYDMGRHTDVIWAILAECNGQNDINTISVSVRKEISDIDEETIKSIIINLTDLGVLKGKLDADQAEAESAVEVSDLWRQLVGRNKPVRCKRHGRAQSRTGGPILRRRRSFCTRTEKQ